MAGPDETPTTPKPDRAQARAAARGTQSNPTREVDAAEKRYSLDELTENPRLVGANSRAIVGALHDETRKTWTLDEATQLVRTFLDRPEEQA